MALTDQSVSDLLAAIRAPRPTPGGGSAAAVGAALGASLLAMVAAMPKHRAVSEEDIDRLQAAAARCTELSLRLESLVNQDSEAYDGVVAAYRLPKATEEQQAERHHRIQEALTAAVEAPVDVMRRCGEAIEAAAIVGRFGNPNAASDVGVALELLVAAARGARLNVDINLLNLDDGGYVERMREAGARLEAECATGAQAVRSLLHVAGA